MWHRIFAASRREFRNSPEGKQWSVEELISLISVFGGFRISAPNRGELGKSPEGKSWRVEDLVWKQRAQRARGPTRVEQPMIWRAHGLKTSNLAPLSSGVGRWPTAFGRVSGSYVANKKDTPDQEMCETLVNECLMWFSKHIDRPHPRSVHYIHACMHTYYLYSYEYVKISVPAEWRGTRNAYSLTNGFEHQRGLAFSEWQRMHARTLQDATTPSAKSTVNCIVMPELHSCAVHVMPAGKHSYLLLLC